MKSVMDRKLQGNASRKAYRLLQLQRLNQDTPLGAEQLPADIIADPADGTVFGQKSREDIVVTIPLWSDPSPAEGFSEKVYLELSYNGGDFVELSSLDLDGPVSNYPSPLTLTLKPEQWPQDGNYVLRTKLATYTDNQRFSLGTSLVVDRTPPYDRTVPAALIPPTVPVDEAYLTANSKTVEVTLPGYSGWAAGDKYAAYWVKPPLPDDPESLKTPTISGAVFDGKDQVLTFPEDAVRDIGDGECYITYVLIDKAGNISTSIAAYAIVDVTLGALPGNFKSPLVPLADGGEIDLKDVQAGVTAVIPAYDNYKNGDDIYVVWGQQVLDKVTLDPTSKFPLIVEVDRELIRAEYGASTGEEPTTVSYQVKIGRVVFGEESTEVNVDLWVPGPVITDPDWPGPVNKDLDLATIYGADDTKPNILERSDKGNEATVEIVLYSPVNEDVIISVYWGTQQTAAVTQEVLEEATGTITVKVPWSNIEQEGNAAAVPVYYTISSKNSINEQRSDATRVEVDAIELELPAPTFMDLSDPSRWINLNSLRDPDDPENGSPTKPYEELAVRVSVPDLSAYMEDGDKIVLTSTALKGLTGEDAIPGAEKVDTLTFGVDYPVTGFTWFIEPYNDYLLPTYLPGEGKADGQLKIFYKVTVKGEDITSLPTFNKIAMHP